MGATTRSADARYEIASRLAGRLVLVFAVARFCTWILLPWPSVLSVPLVLVVYLVALWFTVHYVFVALDELLERKLENLDQRSSPNE